MSRLTQCVLTLFCISATLLLPVSNSNAIDEFSFEIKKLQGQNWIAKSLKINISINDKNRINLKANIGKLSLPEPAGILNNIKFTCNNLKITNEVYGCIKGQLDVNDKRLDKHRINLGFNYNHVSKKLVLDATRIHVAGGIASIMAKTGAHTWHLGIRGDQLDTGKIIALAKQMKLITPQYETSGDISFQSAISGTQKKVTRISIEADIPSLAFSNATGEIAGEEFTANIKSRLKPGPGKNSPVSFDTQVTTTRGTICLDVCWTIPKQPIKLTTTGLWRPAKGLLDLNRITVSQAGILEASGSALVQAKNNPSVKTLTLELDKTPARNLYNTYIQPVLIGTLLDDLDMNGYTSADIKIQDMKITDIKVGLTNIHINDNKKRFGIFGLSGNMRWNNSSQTSPSNLGWQGGYLYKIPFGTSKVNVESNNLTFTLIDGISLPVFDGTLKIDDFSLSNPATPDMSWQFDGLITPISMSSFSKAIGWPEMSGKLSGVIPKVSFANGSLTVGGVLLARAFDGNITIRNLKMERLLGITPTLKADINLDNLSLDSLTSTFSFGNIQGRLSGHINRLNMVNWKPVAFDAKFATPENDDSRHRISQKAVNNLTSIGGGGISGAMSRGFLGIFKEFSYKRLGISCVLENNICDMGGIAPATNGYYIVQGGFIPRIDIIGYSDKVDWDSLVERLQNITSTTGPVVQ
jgi:hypothetical protein